MSQASKHMAVPKDLTGELYWLNYYVDREFVNEFPLQAQFHELVKSLLDEVRLSLMKLLCGSLNVMQVYASWDEYHILSYGFIISAPNGTMDQRFHYDYSHTSSNIFVPLTKLTPLNATQFLRKQLRAKYDDIEWLGDAGA